MKTRGGKRVGAGRPHIPPELRKVRCNVTLAPETLRILAQYFNNRSGAIDEIVRQWHKSLDQQC